MDDGCFKSKLLPLTKCYNANLFITIPLISVISAEPANCILA